MANEFKVKNGLLVVGDISGSTINGLGNATSFSTSVDSRISQISSSLGGGAIGTRIDQIAAGTASVNTFTASTLGHITDINTKTGSFETKFNTLAGVTASFNTATASLNTFSASALTRFTRIEESTASINLFTSSQATKIGRAHV